MTADERRGLHMVLMYCDNKTEIKRTSFDRYNLATVIFHNFEERNKGELGRRG